MPTAIEIPIFYDDPFSGSPFWVGNQGISNVSSVVPYDDPFSGSPFWAGSQGITDISFSSMDPEASLFGVVNSQNVVDLTSVISGALSGVSGASWPGNANNWDVYELPLEEHNHSPITSDNPESTQGASLAEWNFFPFPPEEPEAAARPRDLTRYQKAYSFTRQQPVKIRLFRK